MQPDHADPRPQPAPQPVFGPAPQPMRTAPSSGRAPRRTALILGALAVAAVGFVAVATGVVHVPGFGTADSPPPSASVTQATPQAADEGSHTIGLRIATLTPQETEKASRVSGVYVGDVFPNSPAAQAGLRAGDVIRAVDGVPVTSWRDVNLKIRLTPIGQSMSMTIERAGTVQDASVMVGRCLLRDSPKVPLPPGVAPACQRWTTN